MRLLETYPYFYKGDTFAEFRYVLSTVLTYT